MGDTVHIASCSSTIFALDRDSGTPRWSFDTRADGPHATFHGDPLVADSMIVYPADTGVVYALDVATGDLRWKSRLPSQGVFNDAVAVGSLVVSANDRGGELFALDLETGAHRWTFVPSGEQLGTNAAAPVAYGDLILYGGPDGVLYAIDPESGAASWHLDLGSALETELALADGLLALGTRDRRLVMVDPDSRETVAAVELPGSPDGTPVAVGGRVVVLALPDWLVAVDAASGEIDWAAAGRWSSERALVDGDLLVAGTWVGEVVGLGIEDGAVVWTEQVKGGVRGLGGSGGTYFVGVSQGAIYALRPESRADADEGGPVDR